MFRCISSIVFAVLLQTAARAQQGQPVHIQSENGQEFTAHCNGNIIQSSDGYLFIPQLAAGNNTIVLSFPGTELPEYAFSCTVADTPLSYSLKWEVDNRWSLFDMVEFTVQHGSRATREQILAASQKPGEARPVATGNTAPVATALKNIPPSIRKIFDKPTPGGKDQVYIVVNGSNTDTVAIFIPDIEPAKPTQTGKLNGDRPATRDRAIVKRNETPAVLVRRNKSL